MIATLCLAAFQALAPTSPHFVQAPQGVPFSTPRVERLLVDESGDGTVWVRGEDYKLALSTEGARFFPRERRAARQHHLALGVAELTSGGERIALDRLAAPTLAGSQTGRAVVTFDRGEVVEVWEVLPHGARQSFVLEAPLGEGDLVVRLGLGGDVLPTLAALDAPSHGDGALRFVSPEGGEVGYGDLLAYDRAGRRFRARSRLVRGAIELRVPGAFVAAAEFPLTIDPLITTLNYDGGTDDPQDADCAVDHSLARLLVAYEDTFAANDTDIISRRFTEAGTFLEEVAVDISNEETVDPAVANNEAANQFLIVWTQTGAGLFNTRKIEGRTRVASSTAQGSELNISFAQGNESTPDVGGTSVGTASAPYYVVWSEHGIGSGQDIRGRVVNPSGSLGNNQIVDDFPGDQILPAISKDAGAGGRWCIAYQIVVNTTTSKVNGALVNSDGTNGSVFVDLTPDNPGNDSKPDVAGDGSEFLVVFQRRQASGDSDIVGTRIHLVSAPFQIFHTDVLTAREPGATLSSNQAAPAVVKVANGFVYGYQESPSANSSAHDIYLASVDIQLFGPGFLEGHILASPSSPGFDGELSLCSVTSALRAFPVWTRIDSAGDKDVMGALYDHP